MVDPRQVIKCPCTGHHPILDNFYGFWHLRRVDGVIGVDFQDVKSRLQSLEVVGVIANEVERDGESAGETRLDFELTVLRPQLGQDLVKAHY